MEGEIKEMSDNRQKTSHHLLRSIRNFFSQEPLWKLFSLAAAIFTWFIVMNIINPTEIKTFQAEVTLENLSSLTNKGYVVSNIEDIKNYSVTVKVQATRPALDELSESENKNNIKAKVDLSKLEINDAEEFPKTYSVAIVPTLPSNLYIYNYDVASYYPTICSVEIDRSVSKTVPVELKTYGSPASGYVSEYPVSDIEEVTVTGPESKISQVSKVTATIDITGSKENITDDCPLTVYDHDDNALEGFTVDPQSINVSVEVRKNHTIKIEEPRTTGSLPEHLELLSVEWSPKTIEVTGEGENAPESITLPPIDLTNIRSTTTQIVDISDILENSNLKASSSQKRVTVTIKVGLTNSEKYVITPDIIHITGLSDAYEAEISDSVTAEIGGAGNIDVASLRPTVNLTGLSEGTHSVPLTLTLPEGAVLSNEIKVNVTIKKKAANNTAEPVTEEPAETQSTTSETHEEDSTSSVNSQ